MPKKSQKQLDKEIELQYSKIRKFEREVKPSHPTYKKAKQKLFKVLRDLQKESAKRMKEYFEKHRPFKPGKFRIAMMEAEARLSKWEKQEK